MGTIEDLIGILVILAVFIYFVIITIRDYNKVKANLYAIYATLASINKKELSYKFKQLDDFMSQNPYTMTTWEDFKKSIIFPEKLYVATQYEKNPNEYSPDLFLTVDANYFFNEDTLILSRINSKIIQVAPTILVGLGPFFTFLKMALAFSALDFTASEQIEQSLNALLGDIKVAALCSVCAVAGSLIFILIERMMYTKICLKYFSAIQKEFVRLFDVVGSERFLLDLVKEMKLQSVSSEKTLKMLPDEFGRELNKAFAESTVPYLENILYTLNKLGEILAKNNDGDMVDKLF